MAVSEPQYQELLWKPQPKECRNRLINSITIQLSQLIKLKWTRKETMLKLKILVCHQKSKTLLIRSDYPWVPWKSPSFCQIQLSQSTHHLQSHNYKVTTITWSKAKEDRPKINLQPLSQQIIRELISIKI